MAKFFISSTSTDLTEYRDAVISALRKLDEEVIHMETFTATDANAVERCLRDVDKSDVYLGIFAWRYGFAPPENNPDGMSITEMEYKRAVDQKKRILIFLLKEDAAWPRNFMDRGDAADKMDALRKHFTDTYVVGWFETPEELANNATPAAVHVRDEIREANEAAAANAAAAAPAVVVDPANVPPPRPTINIAVGPFVGRAAELAGWADMLMRPETRLVTVVGPGGMGKSRIAIEIGMRVQDRFADGACFVALESVSNGDEMCSLIAERLKLHLRPQPTVREQLWDFHRTREILIVLDNLESVPLTESGPVIMGLLNAGAQVKVLVTSQIRTSLQPERVVELDSMSREDGREFFRNRAHACEESFDLTKQNTAIIESICETLEHVPLAIELAAPLIKYMSPKEILAKVKSTIDVLVAEDQLTPRRHLAVQAAIEYSYLKLSPAAQELLPQLSVFRGGLTQSAVEEVCSVAAAMGPLRELRNHSLLSSTTDVKTEAVRLRMLEMIRKFSAAKLADPDAAKRHAVYFAEFFEEREGKLRTSEEHEVLPEMEAEFANARAALSWAQEHDAAICSRLALAYQQALYYRGLWADAFQVIETGLDAAREVGDSGRAITAALEYKLASIQHDYGQIDDAAGHAQTALGEFRALGDKTGEANAVNLIGLLNSDAGRINDAEESFRSALSLWPPKAHKERGKALNNLARLTAANGRVAEARGLYSECLRERKQAGDLRGEAISLGNLGALEHGENKIDEAERLYSKSLEIRRDLQEPLGIAIMLNNLAECAEAQGDEKRALIFFVHSERMLNELGSSAAQQVQQQIDGMQQRLGASYYELRDAIEGEAWEPLCR